MESFSVVAQLADTDEPAGGAPDPSELVSKLINAMRCRIL